MAGARTLVLVGPTAVGKTAVALALAESWQMEVVSADSRQIYRGLDIATAKPTRRERQRVGHHLIDVVDPGERYSAGRYALEATEAIDAIRIAKLTPVVVGGTGFYIKALAEGLFAEPPLDRPRRAALKAVTGEMDNSSLVRWASRLDPMFPSGSGRQRAARTIEMALLTGKPLSWWQRSAAMEGAITPWYVRLSLPRPVLHQRIAVRTAEMLRQGLIEEVATVLAEGAPLCGPGMDGIGVKEAVDVLQGRLNRDEVEAEIALSTRQYAKRQETWFRNQVKGEVLALDAARPPEQLAMEIISAWNETEK